MSKDSPRITSPNDGELVVTDVINQLVDAGLHRHRPVGNEGSKRTEQAARSLAIIVPLNLDVGDFLPDLDRWDWEHPDSYTKLIMNPRLIASLDERGVSVPSLEYQVRDLYRDLSLILAVPAKINYSKSPRTLTGQDLPLDKQRVGYLDLQLIREKKAESFMLKVGLYALHDDDLNSKSGNNRRVKVRQFVVLPADGERHHMRATTTEMDVLARHGVSNQPRNVVNLRAATVFRDQLGMEPAHAAALLQVLNALLDYHSVKS